MSLLSRDRLIAVLGATEVALFRQRRAACERLGGRFLDASQPPAWSAAVETLGQLLAETGTARSELRVVLAGDYCRFRLVPWSEAITSPGELHSYARSCFEEIYGQAADSWAVRLSPEPAGRPRLAVAIEQGLLDGLRDMVRLAGWRLLSVQPYLVTAFNRFARTVGQDSFLFILAEPGRNSLLLTRAGAWVAVRSSAGPGSETSLEALIQRERELQALEGEQLGTVYVHAPGWPSGALPTLHAHAVQTLAVTPPSDRDGTNDPLWAMAMVVN